MRSIRFAVAAVLTVLLANPAAAVLVPYEGKGGASGTTTALDPGGVRPRGNNFVDVSPTGACGYTITAGNVVALGCRDRAGDPCPTGEACDLDRVPAGRCTLGNNASCLWPNGAGFCTADPNQGCLATADCTDKGLGGTCDTSPCPGGDCSGCACQGTNDTTDIATFETTGSRCGGSIGLCSDGDTEFDYAPSLSAGLCSYINFSNSVPTNCGREGGGTAQEWTGLRSGFHNPPLTPTLQREPGLGATDGPIVDLAVTQVYDIGPVEANRGGVRRFSLLADSYWADPPWSDKSLTGGAANSHIWTLWCDTPQDWSTDDLLPNGQTCWNSVNNSIGYLWTQNIPTNDYLPSGSATTNLDYDMNGVADCPPHCGLDYDIHTLEQLAIEAVLRLDVRAGAQLALDSLVGPRAGAGDLVAVASIVSNVWLPPFDQRCFMGGDPEAVCSTCVDGPDPDALPDRCSGNGLLSCTTDRDCQLYTGRCSGGEQPCNPAGGGTACPGSEVCRSCVGVYAQGLCVTGGGACRVDSDCGAGDECGDANGDPIYSDQPATLGEVLAANPLAIPVGYRTYGFEELELETRCSPSVKPGRLGVVTDFPRELGVPLAILSTTGKAAAEVRDPDLGGFVANQDNARLGLVRGRCNGNNTVRCSTNSDCLAAGGTCNNAPIVGIADTGRCNGNAAIRCTTNADCTAYGGTCNPLSAPLDGGSYAVGTVFPVDPTGAACCAATGNVTNTWLKDSEVIRPQITPNAGAITWLQGNGSEVDFLAGSGTAGAALLRSGGWGPGVDRTPGCPGDSSNVDLLGAFPDQGPCNDPFGTVAQSLCAGSDCEGNTGADDVRTLATVGGTPNIHVIAARAKVPDPAGSYPTLYSVANLTGVDLDALSPQDTDFSATVEGMNCPMIGDCSQAGVQDCIVDGDCGVGNTCENRVARCVNPFGPSCVDTDGDGFGPGCPAGNDNCPTTANPTQANFDGDTLGDACDACETVVNLGTDTDADGVDNACDTCLNQANAPIAGNPTTNRTFISHQRDDDADGRGNRCDFDYNNAGVSIAANDFNDMKYSLLPSAGLMTQNTCGGTAAEGGSGATQQCGEFDHDSVGASLNSADFNLMKAANLAGGLINTNFPKCTACTVGTGWSNTIASGAPRLGRPVCQTAVAGRCVFQP